MSASVMERSLTGRPPIPAMTTDAERECYYRLTRDAWRKGVVMELGAWLGASTAYIAAALRDEGTRQRVHVYDQFISKSGHIAKVKRFYDAQGIDAAPVGPSLEAFEKNLGPLMAHVAPHRGKIEQMDWDDEPIALLITDAPKRVPAISSVLTKLGPSLKPGSIMAWQDFCHFPSYEIPACLYRLRHHLEFVEAVVPGTTLVFRVKSQWSAEEVSLDALALARLAPPAIYDVWQYWGPFVPEEKRALFACGLPMALCDLGHARTAVLDLAEIYERDSEAIVKKWRYLKENRPDFLIRYAPLFEYLGSNGAV